MISLIFNRSSVFVCRLLPYLHVYGYNELYLDVVIGGECDFDLQELFSFVRSFIRSLGCLICSVIFVIM